ncbi:hypothetical protein [Prosthecomicrobium sp. N25]|uniref:hypothetical protein n=1 Tax=Prosthecomicrobium sp. N25 TaxID=3129254 RepID=UPI003077EFA6
MSDAANEPTVSFPARTKAESKAEMADRAARSIIAAETERRLLKTARLREARLEQEAIAAAEAAPPKVRRKARAQT